jgi:hypothetical protein
MQANLFSSVKQRTHGLDGVELTNCSLSLVVVDFDVDSTED